MVRACLNINVHVVGTDICWVQDDCFWIGWESRPINVHSISKKNFTKHDSRNTQESMFLSRNINAVINFAGMQLMACKQHMFLLEMLKSPWLRSRDLKIKTKTRYKYWHTASVWAAQSKIQFNFDLLWKEMKNFGFPCCRLMHYLFLKDKYWRNNKDFSIS